MKTLKFTRHCIALLVLLSFCNFLSAQTVWDTLPWKQYADWKLQNLNKTFITTNILYDRMFPLANVDEYKGIPSTNSDTTHPDHWM